MTNVIDLRPVVDDFVIPTLEAILIPLFVGFGTLALRRVASFFHVQVTQQAAQVVENAIANGTNLALNNAQALADQHAVVATKSAVIANAVNYALPKITAEMKTAGITPASIAERVEARLPAGLITPQTSLPPVVNQGTIS